MRKYDVAYVPNVSRSYPPIDYKKLSLKDLVEKYIKACAKANGNVSVCSKCKNPCEHGKRAIQLVANEVYNDPPIPLYGGKTLIERAKEENMIRKMKESGVIQEPEKKEEKKPEPKKRQYKKDDDWWDKSVESGDQVQWLIDNHKLSKTQAKKKIYMYKYNHGMLKKEAPVVKIEEEKEEVIEVMPSETPAENRQNDLFIKTMEQKMASLMQKQEEYKALADKYTKLYNETKEQVDVLCKAIDLF